MVCCEVKCGVRVGCDMVVVGIATSTCSWMDRRVRRGVGKCGHEVSLGICTGTYI